MNILKQYRNVPDANIFDSFCKADSIINRKGFQRVSASISGGSDSDIVLDICHRIDTGRKVRYIWFDTGLEYAATKEHLSFLELRYGISIRHIKASLPIPACCQRYGLPFLSKQASTFIERLQQNHFQWEDAPYGYLAKKYPGCTSAIKWWCNIYDKKDLPCHSKFSIARNKGLKEFLLRHPPWFPISPKCCQYAKKNTAYGEYSSNGTELSILGIRKAEGGVRSVTYKSCFSLMPVGVFAYRPLFWYKAATKRAYEEHFDIIHSRCYLEYGMKRTGCAGCPFNREILNELPVLKFYEPRLYAAAMNIFGESYRYTRMYRDFVHSHFSRKKSGQEPVDTGSRPLFLLSRA